MTVATRRIQSTKRGRGTHVDGLRELGEAMRKLSADINNKVSRAAANAAAQVVKKDAIARAPQADEPHQLGRRKDQIAQPGNLKRNIIVKRLPAQETNLTQEYIVGVRSGSGRVPKDAFYWSFIEFGTVKIAAQPFLRPALSSNQAQATAKMAEVLKRRIDKAGKA